MKEKNNHAVCRQMRQHFKTSLNKQVTWSTALKGGIDHESTC